MAKQEPDEQEIIQQNEKLLEALNSKNKRKLNKLVAELHPADIADFIENLNSDEREQFFDLSKAIEPEVLTHLEDEVLDEVTGDIGAQESADAIAKLEIDDAIDIVEELEEDKQQEILEALPEEQRATIEEGLSYPDDSVGRLMHRKFVAVPEYWSVGQVIDYLRKQDDLPEDFHVIYIVDPKHRPKKFVLTSRIMRNKRDVKITDIADDCKHLITPETDQEEAAYKFRQYGLVSTAIVNEQGKMIGVITTEDVVEVIEEESQEDFMRLGGVTSPDFYLALGKTVKKRFPWLAINMVNAFLAAFVIMYFSDSIEAVVALAALAPIVSSVAGNSSAQTLTVTVRSLAKRDIRPGNVLKVINKETFAGLANGTLIGSIAGIFIFFIYQDAYLSGVFAVSVLSCFGAAGFIGSSVPIILNKFDVDPAVASGSFVIAIVDILSFFVFLGLATLLLIN